MPPNERQKVLKSLEKTYQKGQIIFEEGEETRELYILLAGEIEIRKGGQTIAAVSESDTYLGEMSTLLGVPRTATLIAKKDTRMIRVPESKVPDFFAHSPALATKLAKVLAQRLQEMNIKYERMMREQVQDDGDADALFQQITLNRANRAMLKLYKKKLGESMTIKQLVTELDIPISELNRTLMTFGMAHLVQVIDRDVKFQETENKALRQKILDWVSS